MRERREEKRRGKKPKQSTNIANNDFIFIILFFCGEISQPGQKYFQKMKKKQHENFVIFRDLFPPFFETKIIKFATSRHLLVAGFLYIYNPPPPPIFVMELKWPKGSLAKYGIQTRYESIKSLSILHIFGYPIEKSAEIFEIWRLENL